MIEKPFCIEEIVFLKMYHDNGYESYNWYIGQYRLKNYVATIEIRIVPSSDDPIYFENIHLDRYSKSHGLTDLIKALNWVYQDIEVFERLHAEGKPEQMENYIEAIADSIIEGKKN